MSFGWMDEDERQKSTTDLLKETEGALAECGHTSDDVIRVIVYEDVPDDTVHARNGVGMSWERFAEAASGKLYSNDWGLNYVREILMIGKGFFMYRHGYDGSECWRSFDTEAEDGFRDPMSDNWYKLFGKERE